MNSNRYARYERGSPVLDNLAGNPGALVTCAVLLLALGLSALAVASRFQSPRVEARPTPAPPVVPLDPLEKQFQEAQRAREAAETRGDREAVRRADEQMREVQRKHYEKQKVLTDAQIEAHEAPYKRLRDSIENHRVP